MKKLSKEDEKAKQQHIYDPIIACYYDRRGSLVNESPLAASRSPSKPKRFIEHLQLNGGALWDALRMKDFFPFHPEDFRIAHTEAYVDAFLSGKGALARSSGLKWSPAFYETVRYTTGSLWGAVQGAILHPEHIAFSPTSGFHHARPERGAGFCTFSGQVLSAVMAWRYHQKRGAWIDLDEHYGNSLDDSRDFVPDLALALPDPVVCNINPKGVGDAYLADLAQSLVNLGNLVLTGQVDYVCVAHGADSHIDDDLGGRLTTAQWLKASEIVYGTINEWGKALGRPVPVALALFGGYRSDSPESVLELHAADLAIALRELAGVNLNYTPRVAPRKDK